MFQFSRVCDLQFSVLVAVENRFCLLFGHFNCIISQQSRVETQQWWEISEPRRQLITIDG